MRIEFLGTGGAVATPRPGCDCRICAEARERGIPFARSGPSLFVHGPNLLVDTPEESRQQLNRSQVRDIDGGTYSHWHPDHVLGRRVWEARNADWQHWPAAHRQTPIYLPQQVAADFRERIGSWEHFEFLERQGLVRVVELTDGEAFELNGFRVEPFRLAERYVYGFLIEGDGQRLLICPDETLGWRPGRELGDLDLAVLPMGISDPHPLTGEPVIPEGHPILTSECSHRETLEILEALGSPRAVLTHIEEPDGCSHGDLQALAARYASQGLRIDFAYDTLIVDV